MEPRYISLAHGNGGRLMRELIEELFVRCLDQSQLDTQVDAASLPPIDGEIMMSTDGFSVQPLEFPGGDIGSLAVHGTVNDLAVAGARPLYLTLNAFIEEGVEISLLQRLINSLARAAREADVRVVAGDTKVVRRGEGGGLYLATSGLGVRHIGGLGINRIHPGDRILVSGPVGDHGTAVMLAREQFGLRSDLKSDSASVLPLTQALASIDGLRFMRDPTRGGLATVLHEIHQATGFGVQVNQQAIPIRDPVNAVCEMLGFDPLYLACEGRVVAVLDPSHAQEALACWHQTPGGHDAAIIGTVTEQAHVILETSLGGQRVLEELEDEPLPRIC